MTDDLLFVARSPERRRKRTITHKYLSQIGRKQRQTRPLQCRKIFRGGRLVDVALAISAMGRARLEKDHWRRAT